MAFAVIASNIEYRWTENHFAAGVIALMAAMFATGLLSWMIDKLAAAQRALHLKE